MENQNLNFSLKRPFLVEVNPDNYFRLQDCHLQWKNVRGIILHFHQLNKFDYRWLVQWASHDRVNLFVQENQALYLLPAKIIQACCKQEYHQIHTNHAWLTKPLIEVVIDQTQTRSSLTHHTPSKQLQFLKANQVMTNDYLQALCATNYDGYIFLLDDILASESLAKLLNH